ncbi:MAG: 3-hydroxyacyl-CoA dehydrogenase/enoyl-CoA hydratase family protein [Chloroflexota bacterium]|nr:3-hydroxyacyl-CoA dehydrogenase/enoyl-CoA hydratase family protein [Chloroflexota bacterium]
MKHEIRRVVVIGSGTMGGGIAAHVANAGIPVTLLDVVPRDLEATGGNRNAIVERNWRAVLKSEPAALMREENAQFVTLGNLEDDFEAVAEAEWIIEAVVERLDIKQQVMARIDEARGEHAIVSTNTSGIPISAIQEGRSQSFREHFLGTHFFNPPRYLKLVEVIPGLDTRQEVVDAMSHFLETALGKSVVVAKDRPNFIANRIGSWAGQHRLNWIVENNYGVEEVDVMSGPFVGNPKTATFRLLDLVGLDIAAGVAENLYLAVPEDEDRERLKRPEIVQTLLERGALGKKSGEGFYKKIDGQYHPLNLETGEYEPPTKPRFDLIGKLRNVEPLEKRLKAIFEADAEDRVARFWRETTLPALAYASKRIPEIVDRLVDVDNAMKWGFAQKLGLFEAWDAVGVREGVEAMKEMGWPPAPWVEEMLEAGAETFYRRDENGKVTGYWDPKRGDYVALQPRPMEISIDDLRAAGKEVHRNPSASLLDMGDGVLLLEFHSKMNSLDQDIVAMGFKALELLEQDEWKALVIGNQGEHFCVGANIAMIGMAASAGQTEIIREGVNQSHELLMRFRFSPKPVITAPHGMALGGGAEVVMHGSRVVAAAESYIGQVEVGVGLIPGAGGVKELVRRIISPPMRRGATDPLPFLQKAFELIGLAKVAKSAQEARERGFLSEDDRIIMNQDRLLAEAKRTALQMVEEGYTPPVRDVPRCYAVGENGLAALRAAVFGMVQGRYASEHDAKIADKLAYVICGGDLTQPQWVTEDYLNDLETDAFVDLTQEPKSQERIMHMLQTGKPLRN